MWLSLVFAKETIVDICSKHLDTRPALSKGCRLIAVIFFRKVTQKGSKSNARNVGVGMASNSLLYNLL